MTTIGQRFERCPRAWLRDEGQQALEWLGDHAFLVQHGIPPNAGGRLDQDPKFLEAIDVIAYEGESTARALAAVREAKQHGGHPDARDHSASQGRGQRPHRAGRRRAG